MTNNTSVSKEALTLFYTLRRAKKQGIFTLSFPSKSKAKQGKAVRKHKNLTYWRRTLKYTNPSTLYENSLARIN